MFQKERIRRQQEKVNKEETHTQTFRTESHLRIEWSHTEAQNDEFKHSYTWKFWIIRGRVNTLNENLYIHTHTHTYISLHTKCQVTSKVSGIRMALDFSTTATEAKDTKAMLSNF